MKTFTLNLKQILLASATILSLSQPLMADGTQDGGGGTFVQTPASKTLVFWDLYLNNPNFSENKVGDQFKLSNRTHAAGSAGEWVDYRRMKSFLFLKQRLKKWQGRAVQLVNILTDGGIMLRDSDPTNTDRDPDFDQGIYYLLVATPLYIRNLDEISVPLGIDTSKVRALPGARFVAETERIFLSMPIINNAGPISQAAMFLHERMRGVQLDYNLSNSQLQKMVYTILIRNPDDVSQADYDDSVFSSANYNPAKVDKGLMTQYFGQFGYNQPVVGRIIFREKIISKLFAVRDAFSCAIAPADFSCKSGENLASADQEVRTAVNSGILDSKYPGDLVLKSTGVNNVADASPVHFPAAAPGIVLDAKNCSQVVAASGDKNYINTFRSPLYCNGDFLSGVGELNFESALTDELAIEVKGSLYSGNDGGSQISVNILGVNSTLHNEGGGLFSLHSADAMRLHAYVFRFFFKQGRAEIVLNDDGNYKTNTPLISWNFDPGVLRHHNSIPWSFTIDNNSNVKLIKILSASDPSGVPELGPFENWDRENAAGTDYISAPGEACKWGYSTAITDPASKRSECTPKCAPGYSYVVPAREGRNCF